MPRGDYATDPGLLPGVLELLGDVFGPWFAECEAISRRRGSPWEECTTPFTVRDGDAVVAHVGILELPLVIAGEPRVVAGMHAVATRASHRRRGLMGRLARAALEHCAGRYETVVLTTASPAVYARHGFRVVPEHRFVCDAPPPTGSRAVRALDWDDPAELAYVTDLLRRRSPVSELLGTGPERAVFLFDTALARGLYRFPDLDTVAWLARDGGTLTIHDLVAEEIPPLAELLARVDGPVERVVTGFPPDCLGAEFRAVPWLFDDEEYLMVRGPFTPADHAVMLARSARC